MEQFFPLELFKEKRNTCTLRGYSLFPVKYSGFPGIQVDFILPVEQLVSFYNGHQAPVDLLFHVAENSHWFFQTNANNI